ncbi:MAG: F-box protein [Kistimonas sp.]|nr:F-box protein [Kistimonas sp.]
MAMAPGGAQPPHFPTNTQLAGAGHSLDPQAFGHRLALAPLADRAHQHSCDRRDTTPPGLSGAPPGTRQLPTELLYRIFEYLPLSSHSQCALVCHHWRASLPDIRMRIARWMEQSPLWQQQKTVALVPSYNSRARPWLAAQGCVWLPMLERQHQAWLRLHTLAQSKQEDDTQLIAQQEAQQARKLFAGALHYSLHHQMVQTDQLTLDSSAIDWSPTDLVQTGTFSTCGRWLATICTLRDAPARFLRLHGWRKNIWKPEIMRPPPNEPVTTFEFCRAVPDILISVHDRNLTVWRQDPCQDCWLGNQLWRAQDSCRPQRLTCMSSGDLILLSTDRREGTLSQLAFFHYLSDSRNWTKPLTHLYPLRPTFMTWIPQPGLLGLTMMRPNGHGGTRPEVHIWRKGEDPANPQPWHRRVFCLPPAATPVRKIYLAPGGLLLLLLQADRQLSFWTPDAQFNMQQQLALCCHMDPDTQLLSELVPVRPDARQLALPCSLQKILLCDKNDSGQWLRGDTIDMPPASPDEQLRRLLLTGDGRTLVRLTDRQVTIWHKNTDSRWQPLVQRQTAHGKAPLPGACLLTIGHAVCTTAADPEHSLWIHGPDRHGRFVRKACIAIEAPVFATSPDGIALIASFRNAIPIGLNLGRPCPAGEYAPDSQSHPKELPAPQKNDPTQRGNRPG